MKRFSVQLLALLLALIAFGCNKSKNPGSKPRVGEPQQALIDFSEAVKSSDCKQLMRLITGVLEKRTRKKGCKSLLQRLRLEQYQFRRVVGWKRDGRDKKRSIIRGEFVIKGKPRVIPIPVRLVDGRWRVENL